MCMTQDLTPARLHANIGYDGGDSGSNVSGGGSAAITRAVIESPGQARPIPQNSLARLAVLNTLRSAASQSRLLLY